MYDFEGNVLCNLPLQPERTNCMKISAGELIAIYIVSLLILGPIKLPQLLHMLCTHFRGRSRNKK